MHIKAKVRIKRYAGAFLAIYVPIGLATWFLINAYIKSAGIEILNSWLQTEAINIQEGNLLSSFSNHRRILLSSQLVTGMSLVDDQSNPFVQKLISFGDSKGLPENIETISPGSVASARSGVFSHQIFYRFPERQNLLLLFELQPPFAGWIFMAISALFFVFILATLLIAAKIRHEEEETRIKLLKSVLNELNSRATPSPELTNDFPAISASWTGLKTVVENLAKEIVEKTQSAAIAKMTKSLAHDLKNPLSLFEFALHSETFEDFKKSQREMHRALDRIHAILTNIGQKHTDTRIICESGQLNLDVVVSHFSLIHKKEGISILANGGPFEVLADILGIERSLFNLVANAIEAGAKNIEVNGSTNQSELLIKVIDDGPGVPEEIASKLFTHGTTHGKSLGEGIGLFNVKSIVEGHGGQVTYSREGPHSIFRLELPGIIKPQDQVSSETAKNTVFSEQSPPPENGADEITSGLRQPREMLLFIKNVNRSHLIMSALGDLPIKIHTDPINSISPELIYTDDIAHTSHLAKKGVKVCLDPSSRSVEAAVRQIRMILIGPTPQTQDR